MRNIYNFYSKLKEYFIRIQNFKYKLNCSVKLNCKTFNATYFANNLTKAIYAILDE